MAQAPRSRGVVVPAVLICTTALSGCVGTERVARKRPQPAPVTVAEAPLEPAAGPGLAGERIGSGSVKVALVVPLTGQGASVGAALRNAAQLAYDEGQQPDLTLLVEDDGGGRPRARAALRG